MLEKLKSLLESTSVSLYNLPRRDKLLSVEVDQQEDEIVIELVFETRFFKEKLEDCFTRFFHKIHKRANIPESLGVPETWSFIVSRDKAGVYRIIARANLES